MVRRTLSVLVLLALPAVIACGEREPVDSGEMHVAGSTGDDAEGSGDESGVDPSGPDGDDTGEGSDDAEGETDTGGGDPPPPVCDPGAVEDCTDGDDYRICRPADEDAPDYGQWSPCYECFPGDIEQCGTEVEYQRCDGDWAIDGDPDAPPPPMWGTCWNLDEVECLPGNSDVCFEDEKETRYCVVGDDGLPFWDLSTCGV